ncbi:MAG: hypothetical protein ABSC94_00005, partial [Polyangiaceae bacterium]
PRPCQGPGRFLVSLSSSSLGCDVRHAFACQTSCPKLFGELRHDVEPTRQRGPFERTREGRFDRVG